MTRPNALIFAAAASAAFGGGQAQAQVPNQNHDCNTGLREAAVPGGSREVFPGSLQCGIGAVTGGANASAVGIDAGAHAPNASAFGQRATASGPNSSAFGYRATATGNGATSIGAEAQVTADRATAIGREARASWAGSTAVGAGAVTTAPNQVVLGAPGTSVRVGDIGASTAAQSGPLSLVTVDAAGTLGRTVLPNVQALEAGQAALSGRVDALFDLRQVDRRDNREGLAAAVALSTPPFPSAAGRTSYTLNAATFRGEHALGGAIMHRLDTESPFALTAGFSYAGNKNNAARVGVAGEF